MMLMTFQRIFKKLGEKHVIKMTAIISVPINIFYKYIRKKLKM